MLSKSGKNWNKGGR